MRTLFKKVALSACLAALCGISHAEPLGMTPLDNEALQQVDAQGGVDVGLILRLNQKTGAAGVGSTDIANYDYTAGSTYADHVIDPRDSLDCDNRQFCRLALALNNRTSTIDNDPGSNTTVGNKQFLVLKGLQGYIEIPKLSLDAANVTDIAKYAGEANAPDNRVALQLSLDAANPIKIRHLGVESVSIEVGSSAAAGGNDFGYLNLNSCTKGNALCPVEGFTDGKYVNAGFDTGREVGFLGVDIHGNLAVNAKIFVFSCNARGNC